MAIRSIAQLKAWFKRGLYPTQDQFHDWLDSFFHKEDKISPSSVEGLTDQLNGKYPDADGKLLEQKTAELEVQLNTHEQYSEEKFGTIYDRLDELDETKIDKAVIGQPGGVAELDDTGHVPTSQLPSYVDDVQEYPSRSDFPATGEAGKIYVATDTNLTYRWTGSGYVEISSSLALGETSATAYRGDRGKVAYDHSQIKSGNPHGTTFASLPDKPTSLPANGGNAESAVKDGSGNVITDSYFKLSANRITNLNDTPINSLFTSSQGPANSPVSSAFFVNGFCIAADNSSLFKKQLVYADDWYVRSQVNGTWGGWNKLWHSGNLTKLSQLQDDVVAGRYLPLTGGDVSGIINLTSPTARIRVSGNDLLSYVTSDGSTRLARNVSGDTYIGNIGGEMILYATNLTFYDGSSRTVWHSGNFDPTDSWKTAIESTNAKYAFIFRDTVTYDITNLPVNSGSYRVGNNTNFTGSLFIFQAEASNSGLGFYRPGGSNSRPQLLIGLDNSTSKWKNLGDIAIKQDLDDKLGINDAAAAIKDTSDNSSKKIWTGTQAEYDAISTKDSNTIYFIV